MTFLAHVLCMLVGAESAKAGAAYPVAWANQFGTNLSDDSRDIVADSLGNAYVTGGSNSNGFVYKYGPNGNLLWSNQIASTSIDVGTSVAVDGLGNVIAGGFTDGNLAGPSDGAGDAFLVKYSAAGQQQWVKQFGVTGSDSVSAIATDAAGNIIIAGQTNGSLFAPNPAVTAGFVCKLDPAGGLVWSYQYGTQGQEFVSDVVLDHDGNIYVSGATPIGNNNSDAVLHKITSDGALEWTRQLGGPMNDQGYRLAIDPSNHILLAGSFHRQSNGLGGQAFIAKFDDAGDQLALYQPDAGFAYGLATDASGNLFMTGDAQITMLNSNGETLWTRQEPSILTNLSGVATDPSGNVLYAGTVYATSLYGPFLGQHDAFIVKLAVPEPSAFVLAAVGWVLVGYRVVSQSRVKRDA